MTDENTRPPMHAPPVSGDARTQAESDRDLCGIGFLKLTPQGEERLDPAKVFVADSDPAWRIHEPAPPAGEPEELDAILARAGWALFDATKNYPIGCQSPGWVPECVEAQRLITEYQRTRRLGLAARPKVEDAEWLKTTTLYAQWRDVTAKLAECEAELAKADAVIHGMAHHMYYVARDEDAAEKRHAARQQQKASAEPTEREGE